MSAKYLILALVVAVWTGVAAAAIKHGHPEPVIAKNSETGAIPRVVVIAERTESPIPRVVVVGRRIEAPQVIAVK